MKRRNCPICKSRRTHENIRYFVCDRCGYLNKKEITKFLYCGFCKKSTKHKNGKCERCL